MPANPKDFGVGESPRFQRRGQVRQEGYGKDPLVKQKPDRTPEDIVLDTEDQR